MFKLPIEAEKWFSDIRKDLDYDFDIYYFCFMAGLAKGIKEPYQNSESKDLVRDFPQGYRLESKIITALFLKKELDKMGVSLDDRGLVHDTIKKFIDTNAISGINEEGQREMNKYAFGGIKVLKEFFKDKPRTIEPFIVRFTSIFEQLKRSEEI
jgi:hypothetical protein